MGPIIAALIYLGILNPPPAQPQTGGIPPTSQPNTGGLPTDPIGV